MGAAPRILKDSEARSFLQCTELIAVWKLLLVILLCFSGDQANGEHQVSVGKFPSLLSITVALKWGWPSNNLLYDGNGTFRIRCV